VIVVVPLSSGTRGVYYVLFVRIFVTLAELSVLLPLQFNLPLEKMNYLL
jgi:hypothetical protein